MPVSPLRSPHASLWESIFERIEAPPQSANSEKIEPAEEDESSSSALGASMLVLSAGMGVEDATAESIGRATRAFIVSRFRQSFGVGTISSSIDNLQRTPTDDNSNAADIIITAASKEPMVCFVLIPSFQGTVATRRAATALKAALDQRLLLAAAKKGVYAHGDDTCTNANTRQRQHRHANNDRGDSGDDSTANPALFTLLDAVDAATRYETTIITDGMDPKERCGAYYSTPTAGMPTTAANGVVLSASNNAFSFDAEGGGGGGGMGQPYFPNSVTNTAPITVRVVFITPKIFSTDILHKRIALETSVPIVALMLRAADEFFVPEDNDRFRRDREDSGNAMRVGLAAYRSSVVSVGRVAGAIPPLSFALELCGDAQYRQQQVIRTFGLGGGGGNGSSGGNKKKKGSYVRQLRIPHLFPLMRIITDSASIATTMLASNPRRLSPHYVMDRLKLHSGGGMGGGSSSSADPLQLFPRFRMDVIHYFEAEEKLTREMAARRRAAILPPPVEGTGSNAAQSMPLSLSFAVVTPPVSLASLSPLAARIASLLYTILEAMLKELRHEVTALEHRLAAELHKRLVRRLIEEGEEGVRALAMGNGGDGGGGGEGNFYARRYSNNNSSVGAHGTANLYEGPAWDVSNIRQKFAVPRMSGGGNGSLGLHNVKTPQITVSVKGIALGKVTAMDLVAIPGLEVSRGGGSDTNSTKSNENNNNKASASATNARAGAVGSKTGRPSSKADDECIDLLDDDSDDASNSDDDVSPIDHTPQQANAKATPNDKPPRPNAKTAADTAATAAIAHNSAVLLHELRAMVDRPTCPVLDHNPYYKLLNVVNRNNHSGFGQQQQQQTTFVDENGITFATSSSFTFQRPTLPMAVTAILRSILDVRDFFDFLVSTPDMPATTFLYKLERKLLIYRRLEYSYAVAMRYRAMFSESNAVTQIHHSIEGCQGTQVWTLSPHYAEVCALARQRVYCLSSSSSLLMPAATAPRQQQHEATSDGLNKSFSNNNSNNVDSNGPLTITPNLSEEVGPRLQWLRHRINDWAREVAAHYLKTCSSSSSNNAEAESRSGADGTITAPATAQQKQQQPLPALLVLVQRRPSVRQISDLLLEGQEAMAHRHFCDFLANYKALHETQSVAAHQQNVESRIALQSMQPQQSSAYRGQYQQRHTVVPSLAAVTAGDAGGGGGGGHGSGGGSTPFVGTAAVIDVRPKRTLLFGGGNSAASNSAPPTTVASANSSATNFYLSMMGGGDVGPNAHGSSSALPTAGSMLGGRGDARVIHSATGSDTDSVVSVPNAPSAANRPPPPPSRLRAASMAMPSQQNYAESMRDLQAPALLFAAAEEEDEEGRGEGQQHTNDSSLASSKNATTTAEKISDDANEKGDDQMTAAEIELLDREEVDWDSFDGLQRHGRGGNKASNKPSAKPAAAGGRGKSAVSAADDASVADGPSPYTQLLGLSDDRVAHLRDSIVALSQQPLSRRINHRQSHPNNGGSNNNNKRKKPLPTSSQLTALSSATASSAASINSRRSTATSTYAVRPTADAMASQLSSLWEIATALTNTAAAAAAGGSGNGGGGGGGGRGSQGNLGGAAAGRAAAKHAHECLLTLHDVGLMAMGNSLLMPPSPTAMAIAPRQHQPQQQDPSSSSHRAALAGIDTRTLSERQADDLLQWMLLGRGEEEGEGEAAENDAAAPAQQQQQQPPPTNGSSIIAAAGAGVAPSLAFYQHLNGGGGSSSLPAEAKIDLLRRALFKTHSTTARSYYQRRQQQSLPSAGPSAGSFVLFEAPIDGPSSFSPSPSSTAYVAAGLSASAMRAHGAALLKADYERKQRMAEVESVTATAGGVNHNAGGGGGAPSAVTINLDLDDDVDPEEARRKRRQAEEDSFEYAPTIIHVHYSMNTVAHEKVYLLVNLVVSGTRRKKQTATKESTAKETFCIDSDEEDDDDEVTQLSPPPSTNPPITPLTCTTQIGAVQIGLNACSPCAQLVRTLGANRIVPTTAMNSATTRSSATFDDAAPASGPSELQQQNYYPTSRYRVDRIALFEPDAALMKTMEVVGVQLRRQAMLTASRVSLVRDGDADADADDTEKAHIPIIIANMGPIPSMQLTEAAATPITVQLFQWTRPGKEASGGGSAAATATPLSPLSPVSASANAAAAAAAAASTTTTTTFHVDPFDLKVAMAREQVLLQRLVIAKNTTLATHRMHVSTASKLALLQSLSKSIDSGGGGGGIGGGLMGTSATTSGGGGGGGASTAFTTMAAGAPPAAKKPRETLLSKIKATVAEEAEGGAKKKNAEADDGGNDEDSLPPPRTINEAWERAQKQLLRAKALTAAAAHKNTTDPNVFASIHVALKTLLGTSNSLMMRSLGATRLILMDEREFRNNLPYELHMQGITLLPITLPRGDFVLSPQCAVERKAFPDLIGSLKGNNRLNQQLTNMAEHFHYAIVLIEDSDFNDEGSASVSSANRSPYRFSPLASESGTAVSANVMRNIYRRLMTLVMHHKRVIWMWGRSPRHSASMLARLKAGPAIGGTPQTSSTSSSSPAYPLSDRIAVGNPDPDLCAPTGRDEGQKDSQKVAMAVLARFPGVTASNILPLMLKCRSLAGLALMTREDLTEAMTVLPAAYTAALEREAGVANEEGASVGGLVGEANTVANPLNGRWQRLASSSTIKAQAEVEGRANAAMLHNFLHSRI